MKSLFSLVLVSCSLLLSAQENYLAPKKNQIEVFYSVSEFFDGSSANWLFLQKYDYGDGDRGIQLPVTVGLQYTRCINPTTQVQVSANLFSKHYFYNNRKIGYHPIMRKYLRFSARYLKRLFYSQQGSLSLLGGLNYRYGYELYDHFPTLPFDTFSYETSLSSSDFGISAGLRLMKPIFGDFFLSLEASYTRYFLFLYEPNPQVPELTYPSPQNLTINYGLGYRF